MSCKSNDGAMGARSLGRTIGVWSSATLASMMLAACGGGGGGGDSGTVTTPLPTATPPPPPPSNVAPTANAGTDESFALPKDNTTLTGSATDDNLPAGSSISYQWELTSGPTTPDNKPGAIIASPTSASTSVRFVGGTGEYVFTLKASDSALTGSATKRVTVTANPSTFPAAPSTGASGWTEATPAEVGMDATLLDNARDYSTNAGGTGDKEGGYIIRHGKLVYQWGDVSTPFEMKSTTKSMGGLALLLALDEGKVALSDKAIAKMPTFGQDPSVVVNQGALADITVAQLATHTAGLSKSDDSKVTPLTLNYVPGTYWSYSDQGLNWLADVLTTTYTQDLSTLMFSRIFNTIGIRQEDLVWRKNAFRQTPFSVNGSSVERRELASGINANVNAMARVGLLMLNKGGWANQSLLSNSVVALATTPPPAQNPPLINADTTNYPGATTNYGVLWWTNAAGQLTGVPKDAFWAWGLHETLIFVVPSLDLVAVRAGTAAWNNPNPEFWNADYTKLQGFIGPIATSVAP